MQPTRQSAQEEEEQEEEQEEAPGRRENSAAETRWSWCRYRSRWRRAWSVGVYRALWVTGCGRGEARTGGERQARGGGGERGEGRRERGGVRVRVAGGGDRSRGRGGESSKKPGSAVFPLLAETDRPWLSLRRRLGQQPPICIYIWKSSQIFTNYHSGGFCYLFLNISLVGYIGRL